MQDKRGGAHALQLSKAGASCAACPLTCQRLEGERQHLSEAEACSAQLTRVHNHLHRRRLRVSFRLWIPLHK
eukprot:658328-Prymnesium_polylepis.1